jgi:hypothetical protein
VGDAGFCSTYFIEDFLRDSQKSFRFPETQKEQKAEDNNLIFFLEL